MNHVTQYLHESFDAILHEAVCTCPCPPLGVTTTAIGVILRGLVIKRESGFRDERNPLYIKRDPEKLKRDLECLKGTHQYLKRDPPTLAYL